MENLIFNEYKNYSTPSNVEISEKEIIEKIRSDFGIKGKVEKIRKEILKNGKSDVSNKLKKELPAFIIAGSFSDGGRSKNNLLSYYGWMIFDIDNIKSDEEYQKIFNKLIKYPFVRTVFRSPSGNGMKIIVATDNKDSGKHTELYKKLMKHLESVLNVKFDSTCDVNRLCFYSYDPDIYYNENSEIFEFSIEPKEEIVVNDNDVFSLKMDEMIIFTNNRQKYKVGNRNNYLKLLSMNCSNHGIDESEFLEFSLQNYVEDDFDEFEITKVIKETYKKYKSGFGSWGNRLNKILREKSGTQNKKNESEQPSDDIVFEDDIFQQYYDDLSKTFPKKYTDFIRSLKSEREKDIVILTMMTMLNSIYQTE